MQILAFPGCRELQEQIPFLAAGANVNAAGTNGCTILIMVSQSGHTGVVHFLRALLISPQFDVSPAC